MTTKSVCQAATQHVASCAAYEFSSATPSLLPFVACQTRPESGGFSAQSQPIRSISFQQYTKINVKHQILQRMSAILHVTKLQQDNNCNVAISTCVDIFWWNELIYSAVKGRPIRFKREWPIRKFSNRISHACSFAQRKLSQTTRTINGA